jgi:uncharacterized protein YjbJ (UPF0337 family)
MDQNRIEGGGAKTLSGRVQGFIGRTLGGRRLQVEGKMDQTEGRIQNLVGGIKVMRRDDERPGP